jgi:hypothetical protein
MTVRERWGPGALGWLWAAVAVTVAGVVLMAWMLYRESQTDIVPWAKPARVDGEVVHLSYVGSECRDRVTVEVDEGRRRVVLTVRETVTARSCSDLGVSYDLEVRLDRPWATASSSTARAWVRRTSVTPTVPSRRRADPAFSGGDGRRRTLDRS